MKLIKKFMGKSDKKLTQFLPFGTLGFNSDHKIKNNEHDEGISIFESDTLQMTIIDKENEEDDPQQISPLSPQEWVLVLDNGNLNGFSFQRIYFSFLKGIPEYLRFKIWLFFSSQNSTKCIKFASKIIPTQIQMSEYGTVQKDETGQIFLKIQKLTVPLYIKLSKLQPKDCQRIQINKDVHRTYSGRQQETYTSQLLRKFLFTLSNSGIEYSQGMNYIMLNVMIYCLESIGIKDKDLFKLINLEIQTNIFIIMREIVIRMETIFGNNNIFKVIEELQEKISQSAPEVLFLIYKLGLDCFSMFSQHYFSLLCYNQSTPELNKLMMDLFFVVGQKVIHAILIQMLQVSKDKILTSKTSEHLNQSLKKQLFMEYSKILQKERKQAKRLEDFGLSFYQNRSLKN